MAHPPTREFLKPVLHFAVRPVEGSVIANEPVLADGAAPHLELRFDQQHRLGFLAGQQETRFRPKPQRNEAEITDHNLGALSAQMRGLKVAGIEVLQQGETFMTKQTRCQLPASHLNAKDMGRTPFQQDLGKTACRAAEIEADFVLNINTGMVQPGHQFQRCTRNISGSRVFDLDTGTRGNGMGRPCDNGSAYPHTGPQDHVPCPRAALRFADFNKILVETLRHRDGLKAP